MISCGSHQNHYISSDVSTIHRAGSSYEDATVTHSTASIHATLYNHASLTLVYRLSAYPGASSGNSFEAPWFAAVFHGLHPLINFHTLILKNSSPLPEKHATLPSIIRFPIKIDVTGHFSPGGGIYSAVRVLRSL